MNHIQINGRPLCCAPSTVYLDAIETPTHGRRAYCRSADLADAEAGAAQLREVVDGALFTVSVHAGPCVEPHYICARISDPALRAG
jgi:hypothetical protein